MIVWFTVLHTIFVQVKAPRFLLKPSHYGEGVFWVEAFSNIGSVY
jgi:hypothetical protein